MATSTELPKPDSRILTAVETLHWSRRVHARRCDPYARHQTTTFEFHRLVSLHLLGGVPGWPAYISHVSVDPGECMHAQAELEASFRVDGARLSLQRESRPARSLHSTSPPTHHSRPGGQPHIDLHRSCATSGSGDGDRVTMTYPSLPMTVLVSHPRFCLGSPCQGLWQGEPAHMGTCEMSDGVPCETSCAHVSPRAFPLSAPVCMSSLRLPSGEACLVREHISASPCGFWCSPSCGHVASAPHTRFVRN